MSKWKDIGTYNEKLRAAGETPTRKAHGPFYTDLNTWESVRYICRHCGWCYRFEDLGWIEGTTHNEHIKQCGKCGAKK